MKPCHRVGIRQPIIPAHCDQGFHLCFLLMPHWKARSPFIAQLRERSVHAVFHCLPLHRSESAQKRNWHNVDCPETDDVSQRLVRLPLHTSLTSNELVKVIEVCRLFVPSSHQLDSHPNIFQ
ncbi:MAG: DegT/DnrJ/EryC1/StrS family aminotransferase [Flavobacteriales bacterium]